MIPSYEGTEETEPFMMRMNKARLAKFRALRPGRGDVAEFVNIAMDEFIRLWGNRETSQDVIIQATRNVFAKFG